MEIDLEEIKKILPHRYPFLFIDKIIEFESEKKAVAIKNISPNDWFFQGHFPERPIMPGVLIIEAMAQTGGIIIMKYESSHNKLAVLAGVDKVRFRDMVLPGDLLTITAEVSYFNGKLGKIKSFVEVKGKKVCEGDILFTLIDKNEK